jgi:hypothetical protein
MNKENVAYIYIYIYIYKMEYYSAFKKDGLLSFVKIWTHLKDIMLGEINEAHNDKYHKMCLICGI